MVGMAKYRRKDDGKVVEAIQFNGSLEGAAEIADMFAPVQFEGWDGNLLYLSVDGEPLNEAIPLVGGQYVITWKTQNGIAGRAMDAVTFLKDYEPITQGSMSSDDQVEAFSNEIWRVVDRFMEEFDLPLYGAVGVLELVKQEIIFGDSQAK